MKTWKDPGHPEEFDCPTCPSPGRVHRSGNKVTFCCYGNCADVVEDEEKGGADQPDVASVKSTKFRVLDVAGMASETPPDVPWQVDGLAVEGDVTILTGDPGAGKSLLALALSAAMPRGESLAGIGCREGSVIYLDAENGQREIHRRIHSLGVPPAGVTVVEANGVDLRRDDDFAELDGLVEHFAPSLLVLDSLTALWAGANERKTEQVSPMLYALKHLGEKRGLAILLLHHRPKSGGEYRGTTAIAAAAQLGFTLEKVEGDLDRARRRLSCWKCRPAAEPNDRWLHLTAENDMVLVEKAEPYEEPEATTAAPRAPARAKLAPRLLAALGEERLLLKEIATRLNLGSKDATLRRTLKDLQKKGDAVRGDDDRYARCQVSGVRTPKGADASDTPDTPLSGAEDGTKGSAYASPASRDADLLELLGQFDQLGLGDQVELLPDQLGNIDTSEWKRRNGYVGEGR